MKTKHQKYLFSKQDIKYQSFTMNLTPGFSLDYFIGVRNPIVKDYAKKIYKENDYESFLDELPHKYYEENNLHSYLLSEYKDYSEAIRRVDEFLPYVNNWATCDIMKPKAFSKNLDKLPSKIKTWIKSKHTYTIRFGIEMLMNFYLDEYFDEKYLDWVSKVKSKEYYVNMMLAWYYATALAKQYDSTIAFLENRRLDPWVHNKTIQKAIESYRISDKQKTYLRSLKITKK